MTIARNPSDERQDEAGWPWPHRKIFLEGLAAQGYAAVTIQEYRTIAGRFRFAEKAHTGVISAS